MWYYTDESGTQQVAGFVKHFKNIAFVTVKVGICNISLILYCGIQQLISH